MLFSANGCRLANSRLKRSGRVRGRVWTLLRDQMLRSGNRARRADRARADAAQKSAPCETRRGLTVIVLAMWISPPEPRRTHIRRGACGAPPAFGCDSQRLRGVNRRGVFAYTAHATALQLSGRWRRVEFVEGRRRSAAQLAM